MAQAKSTQTKAAQKKKIKGKFYPLQHNEWVKACKELSPAAKDVLYYIRTVDPYSKGVQLTAAAIARELEVHRSTISRAFKELDAKGYVDMEILAVNIRIIGKGLLSMEELQEYFNSDESEEIEDIQMSIESENLEIEKMAEAQQLSTLEAGAKMQQCCENAPASAKMHQPPQKCTSLRENAPASAKMQQSKLETLAASDFQNPKTSKTYSDLIKTLSEDMRGSFEKFCKKKMDEVPFKIGSRLAWLKKYGTEYLEEFKETYSDAVEGKVVVPPKAEVTPPDILTLRKMYGPSWEEAARYYGYELDSLEGKYSAPAERAQSDIEEPILW